LKEDAGDVSNTCIGGHVGGYLYSFAEKKLEKNWTDIFLKKKKKKGGVYATLRTKIITTVPDAVFEASPAVTAMLVLPKPNTKSFTVAV
jgi:hypothetical protein